MKLYKILFLLFTYGVLAQGESSNQSIEDSGLDTTNIKTYQSPNVTVTSTRAKFGVSPVSFSEMDKEEIELRTTAVDLPKILNNQTSVYSYSENGNYMGYSYIRLRGFDQRRISVYINGVPQNDPEIHNVFWLNLNDIQESVGEIQIQRGAGLSNYGAPSIAGSINLTTTNFVNEPGIRLSLGGGFQEFGSSEQSEDLLDFPTGNGLRSNASKMKLEYSSGLVGGKYAFYGKLGRINSGGYRDNSWAQMNSWFLGAVRYDENLTTQINFFGGNQVDGLAYTGIPKSDIGNTELRRANYLSRDEQESFSSPQFQMLNDWKINDKLSFNSTLFYFEGRGYFDYPGGTFQSSFFNFSDGDATMGETVIRGYVGNQQGGWIPRLVYKHNKGRLTTGLEIRMHNSEHWGNFQYANQYPDDYDRDFKIFQFNSGKNVFSFFAKEEYNLTKKLTINLEGQLVSNQYFLGDEEFAGETTTYQTVDGPTTGEDLFEINYLFFNPRVGANYTLNEKLNFYTSVALTSREPRRNAIYNADFAFYGLRPLFEATLDDNNAPIYNFDNPLIEPERLLNIELGSNFKSDYVTGGANIYVMNYTDELVATGQIDIYGAPIEGNAPRTSHYGLEIFGRHRWELGNHNLGLDFNMNYSINQIDEMTNTVPIDADGDFVTDTTLTFDLAGNTIAGFPDYIVNLGADYNFKGLSFRVDAKMVSQMQLNNYSVDQQNQINSIYQQAGNAAPVPSNVIDSYFVMDMNASYKLNNFLGARYMLFKLQVNNLTNELYAPFANESGFFVAAERNYWLGIELNL